MDILDQVKQHANRSVEETIMSGVPLHPKWFQMVADEIERLQSALAEAASDMKMSLQIDVQKDDEIERLREALKRIAAEPIHQCVSRLTQPLTCDRAWIARAALKGDE
jgi:hypothetical protein